MKKKYLTVREIQLAESQILKHFVKFCEKNSLHYFVYGGTLLGTIRHRGFIPWDDDIDIIMPRPDYERFVYLIKKGAIINDNLAISSPELQNKPNYPFMKIYDKTFRIESDEEVYNDFIWIDIFPVDGIKNPPEKELKKIIRLRKILFQKRIQEKKKYKKDITKTRKFLGKIKRLPLRIIPYQKYLKYYIEKCKKNKYGTTEYVCDTVCAKHPGNILKKEWLDKTIRMPFENTEVNVFSGYKHYLENRYGEDYMKLPPKEQQKTHGIKAYKIDKEA